MGRLSGIQVLVVDDEFDLRELMVDSFSSEGAKVYSADCGKSALDLIKKIKFDLIISDVKMPEGDGRFLAEEISKVRKGPKPILFTYSGYNEILDEDNLILDVTHKFSKPCPVSEMIEAFIIYNNEM